MNRFESKSWVGTAHGAGCHDLVAGREDRDAKAAADIEMGTAKRGRERDVLGTQAMPGPEHDVAQRDVFARRPDIGAALQARWQKNLARFPDPHVFLHEDRVGTRRHRCPGENADGVTRSGGDIGGGAGLHGVDDREALSPTAGRSSPRSA